MSGSETPIFSEDAYETVSSERPSVKWQGTGPISLSWKDGKELNLCVKNASTSKIRDNFLRLGGTGAVYILDRDHCSCSNCRHPETKQRIVDTFSIPEDIEAKEVRKEDDGLSISWLNDGHESFYTWDWLRARTSSSQLPQQLSFWDADTIRDPPIVEYETVMESDAGVKQWTALIRKWGFCYVNHCPVTGEATQELLERIAFIRHTHYGGFWHFTSDLEKKDSAYTELALAAHTDTTYFTDPVGFQAFHLLSHTDGQGGASLLVDGFRAAEILRQESPQAFDALCRIKIRSHSSGNENCHIMPDRSFPVFALQESRPGETARVSQVRWNNDDRAALEPINPDEVTEFYAAARKWVEVIRRPDSEYWENLRPGRPLIFDSWRVLHGRSAFTGKRHMCGGYINMDDFVSRWKTLHIPREEILNGV